MSVISAETLGRLIDTHTTALELYAAQWSDTPSDVVQEAFVELIRQKAAPDRLVPWLFRVVRHRAINTARSACRRNHHEAMAGAMRAWWFEAPQETAVDADVAAEALESLPETQREVVVTRIWGDLPFEQIAELVGVSTSTAHRRYETALATLRERLGLSWLMTKSSTKI